MELIGAANSLISGSTFFSAIASLHSRHIVDGDAMPFQIKSPATGHGRHRDPDARLDDILCARRVGTPHHRIHTLPGGLQKISVGGNAPNGRNFHRDGLLVRRRSRAPR
jgi:hypothetical protein